MRDNGDPIGEEIHNLIDKVATEIHKKLKQKKNVIIHCHSGRNRSALAIMAYCAKYTSLCYGEALFQVRKLNSHRFPMQSTLQNNQFTSFLRKNWEDFRDESIVRRCSQ
jgi:protein-tyrosine phosphatase